MADFHIFIASCFEGLDTQVKRLINNIIETNTIPVKYVHFIVGGCPEEKVYYDNGIEIVNIKYRCFEFTPMIYIVNNIDKYDFDYAFFTHDTVKFGDRFYNILKQDIPKLKKSNKDSMKIDNHGPSMNIGVYNKNILMKNKETFHKLTLHTNDKSQLMDMKHKLCSYEDSILHQNSYNNQYKSEDTPTEFIGINGVKAKGQVRNYKQIDFIKYQSNWGKINSIDIPIL